MQGAQNTRIRRRFWRLALILGFLQAWASRNAIIDDTVNYLDMGDYIWRGHWSMAINEIWGPLYAAMLGLECSIRRRIGSTHSFT
jgi:hypothetical protein